MLKERSQANLLAWLLLIIFFGSRLCLTTDSQVSAKRKFSGIKRIRYADFHIQDFGYRTIFFSTYRRGLWRHRPFIIMRSVYIPH